MGRYVILTMRPTSIHFLYRRPDSPVIHEHNTYVFGEERPTREISSFLCIATCIDPETEWNAERLMASLARSEIASQITQYSLFPSWMKIAASRDAFPGPGNDLKDVRIYSKGDQTSESIPGDIYPIIAMRWPWLLPALSYYNYLPKVQQLVLDVMQEQPPSMAISNSPANSLYALSPASFVTARSTPRSTYTSPAYTSARSTPTFVQSGSTQLIPGMWEVTTPQFETIQEESDAPSLPPQLLKLKHEYLESLNEKSLLQSLDLEVNWSGKGQHVTFLPTEDVPLQQLGVLGASMSATVDKVLCRRVALARKTMRCTPRFKVADALIEVTHLQKLRHFHIVQLVGSYLQGRDFSILMYPVADYHLGKFLDDSTYTLIGYDTRNVFLPSIFGCLASAFNFIHKHSTKHMDVKPQNILVRDTFQDYWNRWRVYVADFGLSRDYTAQGHSQTDGRTFLTPRYCAPEVHNFELRGRSADIFSLGCVFLEILTVLANEHPDDFAEFRSRERDNDSFHANLDRVALWAEKHFHTKLREIDPSVREKTEMMVKADPHQRPTALELVEFFAGLPELSPYKTRAYCCSRPPEPYIPAAL